MKQRTLIPALLLLVAGCDSSGMPAEDRPVDALVPLHVGNEWIWHTTERNTVTGGVKESIRIDTARVIAQTVLQGETWFRLQEENGEFLAANRSSGFWQRLPPELSTDDPLLIYKYPAEIGDTFSLPAFPDSSVIRVATLDTTITVPAGTFQAVHYSQVWADQPHSCDFFVAPGLGLIKRILPWVDMDTGEVLRVDTQELIAFTPG